MLPPTPPPARTPLEEKCVRLEREVALLREMVRLLQIEKYGPKSEQLSDAQLMLLEGEPGVTPAEIATEAARSAPEKEAVGREPRVPHPGRQELPASLERRERVLCCTPEQCRCAQCGGDKQLIGYDSSEELDVEPAVYFVRVTRREKRACKRCEELGVTTAAAEPKIVERSKASNRVIVDVLISKYCEHLPLYRQCALLEREAGLVLSRSTLCGWVMQAGEWLAAIGRGLREELLAGSYLQADETPVGVQSKETKGRNHQGYLWAYSRPEGPVVFDFQMGRSREGPRRFLGQFGGILQCDGYAAYDKLGGPGLIYAGCLAHARRGFVDALKVTPQDEAAKGIIARMAILYGIEQRARASGLSSSERLALRQLRSLPVLTQLQAQIVAAREGALPQSAMGKACEYALNQWERLIVFASHGEVEIDNNRCENAIRPVALGRKNWLHIGSEEAGPRVAAIASVIETCRRLGINARDYLMDVLPRVPAWPANRIAELTPTAWAAAQASR